MDRSRFEKKRVMQPLVRPELSPAHCHDREWKLAFEVEAIEQSFDRRCTSSSRISAHRNYELRYHSEEPLWHSSGGCY